MNSSDERYADLVNELEQTKAELERARRELKRQKLFVDQLIERNPSPVYITDARGTMIRSNKALRETLNLTDERLIGVYNIRQDPFVAKYGLSDLVEATLNGGDPVRFACHWDGKEIPGWNLGESNAVDIDACFFSIRDEDGVVVNAAMIWLDVTEREWAQKKFQQIVETVNDWVWEVDTHGAYTYSSPKAFDLLGCKPEDVIGKTFDELMFPDEAGRVRAFFEEVTREPRKVSAFLNTVTRRDGGEVIIETNATPVFSDSTGELLGFRGVDRDVTDRVRAERELNKAKRYIDNIINSMPSILVGVNGDLNITLWNQKAVDCTGVEVDRALGVGLVGLMPWLADDIDRVKTAIRDRKAYVKNNASLEINGAAIHEDITIYPLVTNGVEGAVIRLDDISERYELERQLIHSRKLEAVGQLAGGVAHDFNNTLQGILSMAGVVAKSANATQKPFVEMIIKSVERASSLTSRLLAFSRKGAISFEPVDIHQALISVIQLLERSVDKRVRIINDANAPRHKVVADESQLLNALLNLGINASQAMPDGGILTFATKNVVLDDVKRSFSGFDMEPGDYIQITVHDTGHGIKPEDLNRIFEPFFTTKEPGSGTGLGLASVYGTIQRHHGAITVESEPGSGARFSVYLPITKREPLHDASESDPPISGAGRILIIDDETMIRLSAKALLEDMEYNTILARDGVEGVAIFQEQHDRVDLVILDMIMPKMNGLETLERLRAIDPDVKVIMSSGFSDEDDLSRIKDAGLAAFIQKPYRASELSRVIANVLKRG